MKFLNKLIWSKFIVIGLTTLLVFYGYFYFEDQTITIAYETIQNNIILSILSSFLATYMIILGAIIALIGLIGLFLACTEKGEFLKAFGKSLYLPPVIGVLSSIIFSFILTGIIKQPDFSFITQANTYLNKQFVLSIGIFCFGILMHAWGRKRAKEIKTFKDFFSD